jgi:hypothetical protein
MSFRVALAALAVTSAVGLTTVLTGVPVAAQQAPAAPAAAPVQASGRVFEIRTYIASAGKLDALKARFRDHTIRIFNRHNMTSIAYWQPADGSGASNTLIYILAHESREAAAKNWAAFNADPEWVKIRTESNANGNLVARVDSYFANPSDFSPIK